MLVNRHGVWIDNWIYWMLRTCVTTNDYNSLTNLHTLLIITATAHTKPSGFILSSLDT
jgi:hypothetical protein